MARKMKDSGIEWIGEIPEGWEVIKAKYLFAQRNEKGNSALVLLSPTQKYGVIPQSQLEGVVQVKENTDLRVFKTIHIGDFVISLRSFQGGFEFSNYEGVCSPAYQVFHATKDLSNDFFRYLFKSDGFISKINSLTVGIREGKNIQYWDFSNMLLALPPKEVQIRSAQYLSAKCTEIDTMLSKTRSSIEEYKKLKQAVITQAVTKGVRGEREMKDSGVEWIGEIPKKWNRCKLNSICTFINGDRSKNYPSSEDFQDIGIPFIGADSLNGFFVDTYSARHISPAKYASMGGLKITQGDILYTLRGSTIGKNAIANFNDGTIASSLVGIRVKSPFLANSSFLFYWLNSLNEFVQRDLCINGSTAPNLSAENVAQFFIYIPDITEQHEIADYLDAKCAEIDKLIAKKEQLVKELESYKKSLIYEVVTGKREV